MNIYVCICVHGIHMVYIWFYVYMCVCVYMCVYGLHMVLCLCVWYTYGDILARNFGRTDERSSGVGLV
jgi:hypothetical protein